MDTLSKQPREKIPLSIRFGAGSFPAGATLVSASVSAIDTTTGATVTSDFLASATAVISGSTATATLKPTSVESNNKVTFLATFSDGSVLEEDVLVEVREK